MHLQYKCLKVTHCSSERVDEAYNVLLGDVIGVDLDELIGGFQRACHQLVLPLILHRSGSY